MSRFVDSIIAYRILRMLTTPFEETDAYRLGIVDARGKELKRMNTLNSVDEKDAYSILTRMVFRIKRIIEKVPVENKKLLSFAAALSLIKEQLDKNEEPTDLEYLFLNRLEAGDLLSEEIVTVEQFINTNHMRTFKQFLEDAPVNNAGSPGVAGFTPDTIGVRKKVKVMKRSEVNNV